MKKVLILSRKDTTHPKAGGAEIVLHTYAQGFVQAGYEVTHISSAYLGSVREERKDGIHFKRMFSIHTIYFRFWFWYLFCNKEKYDLIIDHAGGIPLLSPLYIRKIPIIFFTHHLGSTERPDYFRQWIGMARLGSLCRRVYTHGVLSMYRHKPTITVSEGTKLELQKLGFDNIHVLPNSTNYPLNQNPKTNKDLIIMSVGRIVPNKQFSHLISIIQQLHEHGLAYTLYIVGSKQDKKEYELLSGMVTTYGLEKRVIFTGKLSTEEIISLWDRSRYGIITSDKEGFGLTALEANFRGVPTIGYDIPGVNEVILPGINGYLVEKNSWSAIVDLIKNEEHNTYTTLVLSTVHYMLTYPTRKINSEKFITLVETEIKKKGIHIHSK